MKKGEYWRSLWTLCRSELLLWWTKSSCVSRNKTVKWPTVSLFICREFVFFMQLTCQQRRQFACWLCYCSQQHLVNFNFLWSGFNNFSYINPNPLYHIFSWEKTPKNPRLLTESWRSLFTINIQWQDLNWLHLWCGRYRNTLQPSQHFHIHLLKMKAWFQQTIPHFMNHHSHHSRLPSYVSRWCSIRNFNATILREKLIRVSWQ